MSENKPKNWRKYLGRSLAILAGTLALLLIFAYGTMWVLVNGPSPTARRLFVLSVKETSAGGFLANLYLSEEEIEQILSADASGEEEEELDLSLIQIPVTTEPPAGEETIPVENPPVPQTPPEGSTDETTAPVETTTPPKQDTGIEVLDITGSTYNGKLMIIKDPSRVFVGVLDTYGASSSGITVRDMIKKYNCTAGTNAGGFYDPNGQGTGGIPDGIVISEYKLLWGSRSSYYNIAGLDGNGRLYVGIMSGQQALDAGIKYAASYGPALVINGKYTGGTYGLGGGLNPRTAIGQRADGAILLLVINGRSLESLGATYDDLAEIMLSHGAINATNLDGGSSSIMIMNDEYLTSSAYIFGERTVATAILVK
ncbi:MAG: phosphodiester glycosidase family protein [Clostridia bacterium]|nr:phosphodiester glycosidase family protein [Clostridia bacterium]